MWFSPRIHLALAAFALLCFSAASASRWTGTTQTLLKTNSNTTIYGIDGQKIRSTALNGTLKQTLEVDYAHQCSRFTEIYSSDPYGSGLISGRRASQSGECSEQTLDFGEDEDDGEYCREYLSGGQCEFFVDDDEDLLEYLLGESLEFYADFQEYALSCEPAVRAGATECTSTTTLVPNPSGAEKLLRTELQMSYDLGGHCEAFQSCAYYRNVTAFFVPEIFFMQSIFLNDTAVGESREGRVVSTQITTVDGTYHTGSVPSTTCMRASCPNGASKTQRAQKRKDRPAPVAAKGQRSVAEALGLHSLHLL